MGGSVSLNIDGVGVGKVVAFTSKCGAFVTVGIPVGPAICGASEGAAVGTPFGAKEGMDVAGRVVGASVGLGGLEGDFDG